jgi:hypothetical protein
VPANPPIKGSSKFRRHLPWLFRESLLNNRVVLKPAGGYIDKSAADDFPLASAISLLCGNSGDLPVSFWRNQEI